MGPQSNCRSPRACWQDVGEPPTAVPIGMASRLHWPRRYVGGGDWRKLFSNIIPFQTLALAAASSPEAFSNELPSRPPLLLDRTVAKLRTSAGDYSAVDPSLAAWHALKGLIRSDHTFILSFIQPTQRQPTSGKHIFCLGASASWFRVLFGSPLGARSRFCCLHP